VASFIHQGKIKAWATGKRPQSRSNVNSVHVVTTIRQHRAAAEPSRVPAQQAGSVSPCREKKKKGLGRGMPPSPPSEVDARQKKKSAAGSMAAFEQMADVCLLRFGGCLPPPGGRQRRHYGCLHPIYGGVFLFLGPLPPCTTTGWSRASGRVLLIVHRRIAPQMCAPSPPCAPFQSTRCTCRGGQTSPCFSCTAHVNAAVPYKSFFFAPLHGCGRRDPMAERGPIGGGQERSYVGSPTSPQVPTPSVCLSTNLASRPGSLNSIPRREPSPPQPTCPT